MVPRVEIVLKKFCLASTKKAQYSIHPSKSLLSTCSESRSCLYETLKYFVVLVGLRFCLAFFLMASYTVKVTQTDVKTFNEVF